LSASFGIATINHGRPQVFELWCAQIRRLRYDLQVYIPVVCVSGEEDKPLCEEYHINHFTRPNRSVSDKWNPAFEYLRDIGMDYAMILGSDDIISTGLMRNLVNEMERGTHVIGIDTIYFYCADKHTMHHGQMARLTTKQILGVAKCIHKDALDPIGWKVATMSRNWGIDAIISKTIAPYVHTKKVVEGVCVDVKTRENINKWTAFGKTRPSADPKIFYDILSEKEKELLKKI